MSTSTARGALRVRFGVVRKHRPECAARDAEVWQPAGDDGNPGKHFPSRAHTTLVLPCRHDARCGGNDRGHSRRDFTIRQPGTSCVATSHSRWPGEIATRYPPVPNLHRHALVGGIVWLDAWPHRRSFAPLRRPTERYYGPRPPAAPRLAGPPARPDVGPARREAACAVCAVPIGHDEIELEIHFGLDVYTVHTECFSAWQREVGSECYPRSALTSPMTPEETCSARESRCCRSS